MPTTPEQQLALELINLARADPAGQFDLLIANAATQTATDADVTQAIRYFNVDLGLFRGQMAGFSPVAPLAWSDALAQSAETHNDLMIAQDTQGHYLPGEGSLIDRMSAAGYTNIRQVAENIYAYSDSVLYAHAGFIIDWGGSIETGGMQNPAGHRNTILNPLYTEVGIGWTAETDPTTAVGPYVTTQHFGTSWGYEPQLLGVVIEDADGDDFYDIGEGLGGVTVTASGSAGSYVTTSWASGGYQMALPDGVYTVTFSGGGLSGTITRSVTIAGQNTKLDAIADEATQTDPSDDDLLEGEDGDDDLSGGPGDDTILAGNGDDTVDGGDGEDDIRGGRGNDSLLGQSNDDILHGGGGRDTLDGGAGDDSLMGQTHRDMLRGGAGHDRLDGGGGDDRLAGGRGNDWQSGGNGHDTLRGAGGRDTLLGGSGDDLLEGQAHRDMLRGGGGNDTLNGGGSADRLIGGTGDDILNGGGGPDVFIFATGHDADVIEDFDPGADLLRFDAALAGGQSASQIAAGAQVTTLGVEIDFGSGDTILLQGLISTTGLADAIEIT